MNAILNHVIDSLYGNNSIVGANVICALLVVHSQVDTVVNTDEYLINDKSKVSDINHFIGELDDTVDNENCSVTIWLSDGSWIRRIYVDDEIMGLSSYYEHFKCPELPTGCQPGA